LSRFFRGSVASHVTIPRIHHPFIWLTASLIGVVGIGIWGVIFPDARASQSSINGFLRGHGNQALDLIAQVIDRIFSPTYAILLIIALALLIGLMRRSVVMAAGFALAVLVAWLPVQIFKILFHLSRPDGNDVLGSLVTVNPNASFPSGHVGFAIGLSYALFILMRSSGRKSIVAGALGALGALVVLVAYTRLYAGMHYLSDTVGAVFACAAGIVIFTLIWPPVQRYVGRSAIA
jgi:membrane-associated phospholipid phosphatase